MNAKKFLKKHVVERANEGLWSELALAVNATAKLNQEQQRFLVNTIVQMLAAVRVKPTSGISNETVLILAGYINTCK